VVWHCVALDGVAAVVDVVGIVIVAYVESSRLRLVAHSDLEAALWRIERFESEVNVADLRQAKVHLRYRAGNFMVRSFAGLASLELFPHRLRLECTLPG
jgi:hypothetical protein